MKCLPAVFLAGVAALNTIAAESLSLPPGARYAFERPLDDDQFRKDVRWLHQDRTGFLWVGRGESSYRFDGMRFQEYSRPASWGLNTATAMVEGSGGTLWVAVPDRAVARVTGDHFETLELPEGRRYSPHASVIATDEKGRLCVATESGIAILESAAGPRWRVFPLDSSREPIVTNDSSERVWIVSSSAVGLLQEGGARLFPVNGLPAERQPDSAVIDAAGILWVTAGPDLFRLAKPIGLGVEAGGLDARTFQKEDTGYLPSSSQLFLDRSGQVLIATDLGLLLRREGAWTLVSRKNGMRSSHPRAVVEDHDGTLWIGHRAAGLESWPGWKNWRGWSVQEGLPQESVWGIFRDQQERLWVGTTSNAAVLNHREAKWEYVTEPVKGIRSLFTTPGGSIWAYTRPEGIYRIDPSSRRAARIALPPGGGPVQGVGEGPNGELWVFRDRRIFALGPASQAFEEVILPSSLPRSFFQSRRAPDGAVWVATRDNGILRFVDGEWRTFTERDGLRSNFLGWGLDARSREEVWFGYRETLGITRLGLMKDRVEIRHHSPRTSPQATVFFIGHDLEANVWAGTSHGIYVVRPDGGIRIVNSHDGLLWNDCNSGGFFADTDGSVWIGTSQGLSHYSPRPVEPPSPAPEVFLTSASLGSSEKLAQEGLKVRWSENDFQVQFSGLLLREPSAARFRYRLHGFEEHDHQTSNRDVRYSRLPPGTYRFEVHCRSARGVWSKKPAVFSFTISPPWWRTTWFFLAAAAVLASAILFGVRRRTALFVERKRKLEQIVEERTESLRKLTRTVEQTGSSILVTDRDGTIEFVNPAFTTTTGYSNEEAIGQTPRLLRSGRTPAEVYEEMWSAILSGRTWQGELFNRKKDGTFYWEFATVSPIRDNEGRITHFVAIKEDITARKQAEAELVQARERAEAASQAKGAFLANMSHEIRTPMNGVIGMIGLLLDTPLTPVQRGFAETVRNSAESLLIIVNDILDFSRIEAGKLTLEEVEFDLRTALEDIAEFLAVRIQEKGLAFACVVDRDVPTWVSGDPMRLRQVLTNLIGNAIKFTKAGEIAVWVKKESNLPAGIAVRFDVEDTGIGIPQDRVSALFQPFTQADPSHSRIHGGSGLGLAISKRLVEVMGGEIDLESREGKGSRFSFTVHFGRALKGRGGPTDAGVNVAGLRVLIAETHPLHARALRSLMEPWGCLIGEAKTWEEVQNALLQANDEGKAYKAVLLDWKLPGFSDLVSIRRGLGERMQFVLLVPPNAIVEVSRVHIDTAQAFLSRPVKRGLLLRILERVQMGTALSVPIVFPEAGTAQTPKRRILVAEDNEVNRMVIQTTLERMGHAAEVVSNGVEALEALEQARYDLVLMDVQMPGMDGLEATRRIRGPESRVQYREVPIIALTAHAMKGNREECIQAGMDDYLSKPVHPVDLALAVERWAGGPSARTRKMAPSETVPSPLFNRDSLKNRLLGDADMQQEVLREFLEKSRLEIERFQHALLKADLEQLKNSGHRMTGTLGNIGSPRLSEFAAEIELAAGAGRLKEVYALAPRFLSEFENLKQEIERFQEESGH